jgi:uncharacterized protein (DUF983 family)
MKTHMLTARCPVCGRLRPRLGLNIVDGRCKQCDSKLRKTGGKVGGLIASLFGLAILGLSALFSIYALSVWPFLVGIAVLVVLFGFGGLEPDESDPITRNQIKQRRRE